MATRCSQATAFDGLDDDTPATRPIAKRRRGYPSETVVKRGVRIVHGDKELHEKLGRRDRCPCGSGRRFRSVLPFHQAL